MTPLLVVHESKRDFEAGQFEATRAAELPAHGVELLSGNSRGSYTSPAITAAAEFESVVLSVNFARYAPTVPGVVGLVSVRTGRGWSPWFRLLRWGIPEFKTGQTEAESGRVDVDLLHLSEPAREVRYSVAWHATHPSCRLTRVALSLAGTTATGPEPAPIPPALRLEVPFLSQWDASDHPPSRVCSPTCLAMVAGFFGVDLTVDQIASLAFDLDHSLYGNWSTNVLAMSLHGFRALVEHAAGLAVLDDSLRAGHPVIASIAFREQELKGAPMESSKGHLVVVAGLTDRGDYLVRDPAARDRDDWREYSRPEFERAWLGHGGICYRIRPEVRR